MKDPQCSPYLLQVIINPSHAHKKRGAGQMGTLVPLLSANQVLSDGKVVIVML